MAGASVPMTWSAAQLLNPKPALAAPSAPQIAVVAPSPVSNSALGNGGDVVFQFAHSSGGYRADISGMDVETDNDAQPVQSHPQPVQSQPQPLLVDLETAPMAIRSNIRSHSLHITPIYQSGFGMHSTSGLYRTSGPQNGFVKQIERLNNVQDRSDVPQPKRRKTQTESDPPQPGTAFAAASSGDLAAYIKQQNESDMRPHKPPTKPAETVDLTDGDGQPAHKVLAKDEEVCFGMVEGAMLNCHRVPAPKPGMVAIGGDGFWPQVKVVLRRRIGDNNNLIQVYDCTRQVFGCVDSKTALCLSPLLDATNVQLRTDARIPTRRKDPGEQVGQAVSRVYKFELMLYGRMSNAMLVARQLCRHKMNLVSPPRVDAGVKVVIPMPREKREERPASAPRLGGSNERPSVYMAPPTVRTVEEIRSEVMGVFDSLPRSEDLPELEPSRLVVTELLRHQKQALYFMTSREQDSIPDGEDAVLRSTWRCKQDPRGAAVYHNLVTGQSQRERPPPALGGILADMMGLGKTLSVMSLVTYTLEDAERWAALDPVQPQEPERKQPPHHFKNFDVPKPQNVGLTPLKLNGKATLLICPLSTVTNWEEQIKQHIKPNTLNCHIYHGPNREKDPARLAMYDLVITTYGSVSSELNAMVKKKKGQYPLEEIGWFRIVLDEAHMIREQNTLAFKSICRLQASRRWAVTGTPVQNKLEDLASLLAFLRLKPFDERNKFVQHIITPFKAADPEIVPKLRVLIDTVTLRRLKDKISLPKRTDHIIKLTFNEKEQQIYDWFAKNTQERVKVLTGQERIAGRAMIHILRSILQLRLICAHGKELLNDEDLLELKGMTADTPIDLSDEEEEKAVLQEGKAYEFYYLMQEAGNDNCTRCRAKLGSNEVVDLEAERQEDVLGYMSPRCFHLYCPSCIDCVRRQHDSQRCDECCAAHRGDFIKLSRNRALLEHDSRAAKGSGGSSTKDVNGRGEEEPYHPHTKTRALVEDLLQSKQESAKNPHLPPLKSVVFSGWTSHLDLIEKALGQVGITFTRLDGKMSRTARNEAMEKFRTDPDVQVILVSIMAGGLGLNLTAANTVYVMEPQFNPAAEAQAVDRVHRLGQTREVRTVRYIMQNSFEEKMLVLQEKKTKLANLSMDGRDKDKVMDRTEAARQRLMDLRSLFK